MRTVDDQLDRALFNERLLAMLASAFAGLAMLLAVVGVYGDHLVRRLASHARDWHPGRAGRLATAWPMWLILRDAAVMLLTGVLLRCPRLDPRAG